MILQNLQGGDIFMTLASNIVSICVLCIFIILVFNIINMCCLNLFNKFNKFNKSKFKSEFKLSSIIPTNFSEGATTNPSQSCYKSFTINYYAGININKAGPHEETTSMA